MSSDFETPVLLQRTLESQRVHSAYLFSGPGDLPRGAALNFARGLACTNESAKKPCEQCASCQRSVDVDPIEIDGTGKSGPVYRHIGDHPDLLWVDRGQSTRILINQIRALQAGLHLGSHEGGWRVAVIDQAEWLNSNAQNALLRILEEPPDRTCILLVTVRAPALLATLRSRCQRVRFPAEAGVALRGEEADPGVRAWAERLDHMGDASVPDLLDWAEEFRGPRAEAASGVDEFLTIGSAWLREHVSNCVADNEATTSRVRPYLDAFRVLGQCRRDLAQRNANPQMVAERALMVLRQASLR